MIPFNRRRLLLTLPVLHVFAFLKTWEAQDAAASAGGWSKNGTMLLACCE